MDAPFLGGHPAVDFLNTRYTPDGRTVETLTDGRAFVDWLVAAGLLDQATAATCTRRFGRKALDASAEEARRVRERARAWLARWREAPDDDYRTDVSALNALLGRVHLRWEVLPGPELALVQRSRIDTADALVGLVAVQLAQLITEEDPARLKQCAGSQCSLWFLDRTKAQRRKFCTASVCGNRAKVSAFRARQRQSG